MCGRYRLTASERYLRDHFGLADEISWSPHWNIAPTQPVPVVRQQTKEPKRTFACVRWGLIPYWAKDPDIGMRTLNAMSETAAEKPAFRDALKWRRCLIPVDAFYEWQKVSPKEKQPYSFGMADGSLFAFAGLWDRWQPPTGEAIQTCTILTTRPNALVESVHNRMPVILRREYYDLWLDPNVIDTKRLAECLEPFDANLMRKYPVSTRVNRVDHDDADCAKEISVAPAPQLLF